MKTFGIILVVLLMIVALLGAGLQLFLTKELTTVLNQSVFPAVKSRYGLDLSITKASVNLFKGRAELDGFTVRNLKGYQEPCLLTFDKCLIEIEMMSLLKRDPVIIKLIEAKGATLVLERNQERKFNVKELADTFKPVESSGTIVSQQTVSATEPSKPVPVHIRKIAVDALVKCINLEWIGNIDMNFRLTGSDLFTVPAAGQPDSLIVLRGEQADKKEHFVTDISAILSPLTDPKNPTFNITGDISGVDERLLGGLLKKNKMESGPLSIKPSIVCQNGQLKGSRMDLVLSALKIYGTEIGNTTLKAPLNGTLQSPALDLTDALNSLFSEQSVKIGTAIGLRKLRKEPGAKTKAAASVTLTNDVKEVSVTPAALPPVEPVAADTPVTTNKLSGEAADQPLADQLSKSAKELRDSPALQQLIEHVAADLQTTNSTATNKTSGKATGEALADQLNKTYKELEDNKAVKESLKNLGNSLLKK